MKPVLHLSCLIFRRNFGFLMMPEGLPNGDSPQIGKCEVAETSDFKKPDFDETESPSSESITDESPKVDVALQIAGGAEHNANIVDVENVVAGGNEKKNDNPKNLNDVEYKSSTNSGVETQVAHGPTLLMIDTELNVEINNVDTELNVEIHNVDTDLHFVSDDNLTGDISPEETSAEICNVTPKEAAVLECHSTQETPDEPEVYRFMLTL